MWFISMMLTSAAVDCLLHPLVDIAPPSGLVCPILRQVAVVLFVNLLLTWPRAKAQGKTLVKNPVAVLRAIYTYIYILKFQVRKQYLLLLGRAHSSYLQLTLGTKDNNFMTGHFEFLAKQMMHHKSAIECVDGFDPCHCTDHIHEARVLRLYIELSFKYAIDGDYSWIYFRWICGHVISIPTYATCTVIWQNPSISRGISRVFSPFNTGSTLKNLARAVKRKCTHEHWY